MDSKDNEICEDMLACSKKNPSCLCTNVWGDIGGVIRKMTSFLCSHNENQKIGSSKDESCEGGKFFV